ncbi:MAG: hypothetical protein LBT40_17220 [Deltaproteobacteria bacterium]|nr:hypothetical protein [Deltaproteobacteria bacterium]
MAVIDKNGLLIEVEVAVTPDEIRRDFLTGKHGIYRQPQPGMAGFVPNKFFYAVPVSFAVSGAAVVKELDGSGKYGVMSLTLPEKLKRNPGEPLWFLEKGGGEVRIVKRAGVLNDLRLDTPQIRRCMEVRLLEELVSQRHMTENFRGGRPHSVLVSRGEETGASDVPPSGLAESVSGLSEEISSAVSQSEGSPSEGSQSEGSPSDGRADTVSSGENAAPGGSNISLNTKDSCITNKNDALIVRDSCADCENSSDRVTDFMVDSSDKSRRGKGAVSGRDNDKSSKNKICSDLAISLNASETAVSDMSRQSTSNAQTMSEKTVHYGADILKDSHNGDVSKPDVMTASAMASSLDTADDISSIMPTNSDSYKEVASKILKDSAKDKMAVSERLKDSDHGITEAEPGPSVPDAAADSAGRRRGERLVREGDGWSWAPRDPEKT